MKKNIVMNATTARKNFFQLLRDVGQHGYSATIIQSDTGARFKLHLDEESRVNHKRNLIKEWDDIHLNLPDFKILKKIIAESKNRKI